jgi:hypothetical protein
MSTRRHLSDIPYLFQYYSIILKCVRDALILLRFFFMITLKIKFSYPYHTSRLRKANNSQKVQKLVYATFLLFITFGKLKFNASFPILYLLHESIEDVLNAFYFLFTFKTCKSFFMQSDNVIMGPLNS